MNVQVVSAKGGAMLGMDGEGAPVDAEHRSRGAGADEGYVTHCQRRRIESPGDVLTSTMNRKKVASRERNDMPMLFARTCSATLLALSLGIGIAAPAAAQTKIVMTNETAASSVKGKTFEVFKQEIERRLGNKVAVETHHSGTLFNQKTQIQAVQLGSAQFVSGSHGSYGSLAPKITVLSLPFLFPNAASIDEAVNDPIVRRAFEADLEKKNLRVVGIWLNGQRDVSSRTQKPILLPTDLQGVKIRVHYIGGTTFRPTLTRGASRLPSGCFVAATMKMLAPAFNSLFSPGA